MRIDSALDGESRIGMYLASVRSELVVPGRHPEMYHVLLNTDLEQGSVRAAQGYREARWQYGGGNEQRS